MIFLTHFIIIGIVSAGYHVGSNPGLALRIDKASINLMKNWMIDSLPQAE
jgi:hypothetical protein